MRGGNGSSSRTGTLKESTHLRFPFCWDALNVPRGEREGGLYGHVVQWTGRKYLPGAAYSTDGSDNPVSLFSGRRRKRNKTTTSRNQNYPRHRWGPCVVCARQHPQRDDGNFSFIFNFSTHAQNFFLPSGSLFLPTQNVQSV